MKRQQIKQYILITLFSSFVFTNYAQDFTPPTILAENIASLGPNLNNFEVVNIAQSSTKLSPNILSTDATTSPNDIDLTGNGNDSKVTINVTPEIACENDTTEFFIDLNVVKLPNGYNLVVIDSNGNELYAETIDQHQMSITFPASVLTGITEIVFHVRHDEGGGNGEDTDVHYIPVNKKVETNPIQLITME